MTTDDATAPPPTASSPVVVPVVASPPTSPPTSPPAKRVKTTMADIEPQPPAAAASDPVAVATIAALNAAASMSAAAAATADVGAGAAAFAVKKLSPDARLPTRGSAFAAGYDLYAARPTTVPARGQVLVDTDIAMAVPLGTYGRVAPRSGLAAKHGINTGAGVIDADYRGPVRVLLFNHRDQDFAIAAGDRVAQLVLERIVTPDVVELPELPASVRGAGGFGSTGGFGAAPAIDAPGGAGGTIV